MSIQGFLVLVVVFRYQYQGFIRTYVVKGELEGGKI